MFGTKDTKHNEFDLELVLTMVCLTNIHSFIEQCFHCVDVNKTIYQTLFQQSVQACNCLANSSEINFAKHQLYVACDAFQCLLADDASYSSTIK